MIHTFHIDDSNESAKDFLKFIKSLDFVVYDNITFTDQQKKELEKRRQNAKAEDFIPMEDVNKRLNQKYEL